MLKIVLFGSGGAMPTAALKALEQEHSIVAVVAPAKPTLRAKAGALAAKLGLRQPDPFVSYAQSKDIPVWSAENGHDPKIETQLRKASPDLICIASFPWLLHEKIFSVPARGGLNVHPSLLPRHRGPNPFFWTYYHDDRRSGVTVHRVTAQVDAGDIISQKEFDLPRGHSIIALHDEVSRMGGEIMTQAVAQLEEGSLAPTGQDETVATRAPKVKPGTPMVDFARWPAERVWHFLSGLLPFFREPLENVPYDAVSGFVHEAHSHSPGQTERVEGGWRLFCLDGYVTLTGPVDRR